MMNVVEVRRKYGIGCNEKDILMLLMLQAIRGSSFVLISFMG